jgi:hypothetical protein
MEPTDFAFGHLHASPAWRAWAGRCTYQHAADPDAREAIALHYGLIAPETKAVLVSRRAEADKIDGLPVVVPVPHMMPAGMMVAKAAPATQSITASQMKVCCAPMDYLDSPGFMRRSVDPKDLPPEPPQLMKAARIALAEALRNLALRGASEEFTLDDLLEKIAPPWREAVREYCEYHGLHRFHRHLAATQLAELLDDGVDIDLNDEDEVRLALLRWPAADDDVPPDSAFARR